MQLRQHLRAKRLLVLGDAMLDLCCTGSMAAGSREKPFPVFREETECAAPGGAANVACNLAAAGQGVALYSVIGADAAGDRLLDLLRKHAVDVGGIVRSRQRRTTVKKRLLSRDRKTLLRVDTETPFRLCDHERIAIARKLQKRIHSFDLIILSDYRKGVLRSDLVREILDAAHRAGIRVLVDTKTRCPQKYARAFLLKPNLDELQRLTGQKLDTPREIGTAAVGLCRRLSSTYILATCGAQGMVLADQTGRTTVFSGHTAPVSDPTGAGDSAMAYLGAALANHMSMRDAVACANAAGAVQAGKFGTAPVYPHEVEMRLQENDSYRLYKRIAAAFLPQLRQQAREKRIVFTNGCFDILHAGHVQYLRQAAALGDMLVVAVNSDASVRRLKGKQRPILRQEERLLLLEALEFVDYVLLFDADTPYELIRRLRPDILVKGADYRPEEVVGKDLVEAYGGRLVLLPLAGQQSTSAIIQRVEHLHAAGNRRRSRK